VTTFAELKTAVSRDIRDPDNETFVAADVADLINGGIAEVSRFAPRLFQEDITPVVGDFKYHLLAEAADSSVEVRRVEVWDTTTDPERPIAHVPPGSESLLNASEAGWDLWAGWLWLPYTYAAFLDPAAHMIKVWGYAPYTQLVADDDVTDLSVDAQWAVREFAAYTAYDRLVAQRSLYTQWQTAANNADISPAGLMNALSIWQQKWERRRKQLLVLRESP
jgi:hypothetical protein